MADHRAALVATPHDAGESGRSRMRRLDAVALVSVCFAFATLLPIPGPLQAVLLTVFLLVGPGAAVMTWIRVPAAAVVAAVPVVGIAAVAASTTVLAWFHRWPPTGLLLALAGAVLVSASIHDYRTVGHPGPMLARLRAGFRPDRPATMSSAWARLRSNLPLRLLIVGLVCWAAVLPGLRDVPYSQFGLLFVGAGPGLVAALVLVVVAFLWALREGRLPTAAVAIGAAILVQRVTVTLITEVPIYGWTYKHIGVVDYIERFHALPPEGIDIYGEWPAFFTSFAWFGNVTSVDALLVAHWFAPVVHALLAIGIVCIALLIGLDIRVALAAAMIAEIVNWVGQDYFSPQALALVMALGIVALLIASRESPRAAYPAVALFAALVPTHQLTPYWLLAVAALLTVTRRVRPWWIPVAFGVLLFSYLVPRLDIVAPYGLLSGFNPIDNAASNVALDGTVGKLFTSVVCRSLSAGVILVAAACAVLWWRRQRPSLIAAVMAFSSFVLLAGQSYGGEAIFRVYLYAVPGCAILIAPLLVDAVSMSGVAARLRLAVWAGVGVTVIGAVFAGLQGYFGLWSLVIGYRSQVVLAEDMLAAEQAPATVMSLYAAGLPTRGSADYIRFAEYDKYFDRPYVSYPPDVLANFPDSGQVAQLTAEAAAREGDSFIVLTAQASAALEYYGYFPAGAVEEFERQLWMSTDWTLYAADGHTTVFRFSHGMPDRG
ncbi:hypothetical protein ERC79_18105 [Rhodococcus sp. ABRD24]|uniref:hypothetical protein n=1 Tax=Rhodococcus sp. ABRD24 TaxID=2507582 RepID=UPI00103DF51B|nr:hypothetical protein [Rhodococcus sp. ABRD24]QBJ97638.1 hypothetical protein ERC79_18105 [Rhodococcus sp. ABRD24]